MADGSTTGLDMLKTIDWYRRANIGLPCYKPDVPFPYLIEDQSHIELSYDELQWAWNLFPKNAQERSILRKIVGQASAWFAQASTSTKPVPTHNRTEALSSTAIIPSYIDYTAWRETGNPTADIFIYRIPRDLVPEEEIRKLILKQGLVHELGHSIVQPCFYIEGYTLRFPDGKEMAGLDAMLEFAQLAEKHPPISQYASIYRGKENKFESEDPEYNLRAAISEELVETIAAYLLGFAYCQDERRNKEPFTDRKDLEAYVHSILHAERRV